MLAQNRVRPAAIFYTRAEARASSCSPAEARAWTTLIRLSLVFAAAWLWALPAARADQEGCLKAHEQAQLERLRGRFVEAREQLLTCAQASCPGVIRGDCKTWLQEVDSSLPSLVFAVADEQGRDLVEARVSTEHGLLSDRADGRALAINPGVYKVRIEAAGYEPAQQQVSVREGEKRRLVRAVLRASSAGSARHADAARASGESSASAVDARGSAREQNPESQAKPPAPELRAKRLMLTGYVLGGVGFVSLVTGVALGAVGKHELKVLRGCTPECTNNDSRVAAGKRKYVLADVAFGAAGALIATAVVSWALGFRKQRETRPPALLSLHVDPRRVSFGWGTRF
jgi:hypothetical protein